MAKRMVTSAAANKMVRKLQDDKEYFLKIEKETCTYLKVEGCEATIPKYDYTGVQDHIMEIDWKIRTIKHAINVFNTTTILKNGMALDEALVKLAQLNKRKEKLDVMRNRIPNTRKEDRYSQANFVEYICLNYDLDTVRSDYDECVQDIVDLQMEIDLANQTKQFEIEI